MSRVGEKPVAVPAGVTLNVKGRDIEVSGPKGRLAWTHPPTAEVLYDDSAKTVTVKRKNDAKQSRAKHGLTRALIDHLVKGV